MKGFVQWVDRQQATLLPEYLDNWVDESNPVRAVDVFVDALELRDLGFDGVTPAATGRPGYHPSAMLKLYIFGYLNRVQSSRRLEREAGRNLEVMWLTGRLVPDHKTIADFRRDNGPAIKRVCAQFVALCRKMGLLAKASVAIDGSKFKAVNSRDNNFTKGKMERRLAQIEESVARYLSQLDTADRQTAAGEAPSEELVARTARLKEKLIQLEEEVKRLKAIEKVMLAAPDQQISFTDPDSRSMATSGRGSGMVGYNVQAAVDTTNHLIVAHEVTNVGADKSHLANMANQAKVALEAENLEAFADRGLCLPHIKSGHIDGAIRPESDDRECVRLSRRNVTSARPCSMTNGCACRCNSSCTTAARGADGVRRIPRHDQCIPCGSNRSAVLHTHFATVSEEKSGGLGCRSTEPGG